MKNPETSAEWQEAVDAAELMLLIQSAAMYGLIETDLQIDSARCEYILQTGARAGITSRSGRS
ncbi:MAG TPA: hypothetical protein VHA06_07035 [Candidatus Angelobacter sp.]|jgi:hypothetical protein|nr:hypothetical protein [Candidatus Angelobacter sp.]